MFLSGKQKTHTPCRRTISQKRVGLSKGKRMKLSEFYPEYMSSCDSLRASTRVGYESAYRVHLQAAFGDVELLDITVQRVETWAARYADHPGACRKAWAVLRQMLHELPRR